MLILGSCQSLFYSMAGQEPSSSLELLFQASTLDLVVPHISAIGAEAASGNHESARQWWEAVEGSTSRQTAFIGNRVL